MKCSAQLKRTKLPYGQVLLNAFHQFDQLNKPNLLTTSPKLYIPPLSFIFKDLSSAS